MKGGKTNASFSSSNINSTCCILNCNKPSSIRNFSCLQGVWKVKLEHAQSANIEGLKICTTHYNDDLRQHPRVGGQGNNHHTTRKDKQRKRRLQEEKKRLLTEAVKKNGGERPQELEDELNKISAQIDEYESGGGGGDDSPSSSTTITPRTVRKRTITKKRKFKEDEAREDYSSNEDDYHSALAGDASSSSDNTSISKIPKLETSVHYDAEHHHQHVVASPQKQQQQEMDEETVQQQQLTYEINQYLVSNNKRKRNFAKQMNSEDGVVIGKRYYELLSGNGAGGVGKFAEFAPHISMVHNLSNNLSLKYDLTLFREMMKLFPPNKYIVHVEDSRQRYILKLYRPPLPPPPTLPSSENTATISATSDTSTLSTTEVDATACMKPNLILFTFSYLNVTEVNNSNSVPHLNEVQSSTTVSNNGVAQQQDGLLHENISWNELVWGLQSLQIRGFEYELRCFQFVPISE